MTLWPQGFGMMAFFLGLLCYMAVSRQNEIALGKREKFFVLLLLLLNLGHIVLLASPLEIPLTEKNYFSFDGSELVFALMTLIYFLLNHLNLYRDRISYERELAAIQLVIAFLSLVLIFSNHMLVVTLALPLLILTVAFAPQLAYKSKASISMNHGISWAALVLLILALSSGLIYQELQTLRFDQIQKALSEKGFTTTSLLGWGAPLVLFCSLLCFPVFTFFAKDYEKADSWTLIGLFRQTLPLLGAIMICRWILSMAGSWEADTFVPFKGFLVTLLPVVAFGLMAAFVLVQTLFAKNMAQIFQIYSIQPLLLTLWSLSSGTKESFLKGVAGLFLYTIAVPLTLKIFMALDLKPFESTDGGRLALRAASFFQRLQLFALFIIFSPLGTFVGFSLIVSTAQGAQKILWLQLMPVICAASLMISLISVLGELFDDFSPKVTAENKTSYIDNIIGYSLLIFVITLGIYPSPLYKYVSYILSRMMIS
ncbi:MAG: hypothetical protein AB7F59_00990 [Bdellovibrionales bacterium]